MTNGCRQGAIVSAIAYCFYCEGLFALLKRRRAGCWVKSTYCGIFGYSDDNWALAPSLDSLQRILVTCQEYAASHNLKFSTDPNPNKCKTKCLAFLKIPRKLPKLLLCGNELPWADKLKHLGNTIDGSLDGGQLDTKVKSARYVQNNVSLNQEFYFAHPKSKVNVNSIYNTHYTGSQIWNLFGSEAVKLEGTYNRSVKIMCDLPYATHRYFIEHVTEKPHIRKTLVHRYLKFVQSIEKSSKSSLHLLLNISKNDVRSVTGANLRQIMLLCGKNNVNDLSPEDAMNIPYHEPPEGESWRLGVLDKLLEVRHGELTVPGFNEEELDQMQMFICTS